MRTDVSAAGFHAEEDEDEDGKRRVTALKD